MKKISIALLLLLPALSATAQFVSVPGDARSGALGGCREETASPRYVDIGYRQAFAAAGMATKHVGAGWTLGTLGAVEARYSHFGDADYNEQQLSAACRMAVDERLDVGVEGRYCRLAVGDGHYEPRQWMALAATARLRLGRRLQLSALAGTRPWDTTRPWQAHVTAAYRPVEKLLTLVELESEERTRLRLGMEYCYGKILFFRAGMATAPVVLTFGLGVRYGNYVADIAVESHSTLGLTPQISLALCF